MPMTGSVSGGGNGAQLARVNFLREEPGDTGRFFVNDLNGPLYMLDKTTKEFTTYLDFNGRNGLPGMFDRFTYQAGFANGLITFQFDSDYGNNGTFYTVHMEEPDAGGSQVPDNANFPGLDTTGYLPTSSVNAPGSTRRHTILIEWTDNDVSDSTFEGTARELLRLDTVGRIHPMGDIVFNPLAEPGDPDWRVMYVASGDGGSGEQGGGTRDSPQRLDTLVGKMLRLIPDLDEQTESSSVSDNGRYRIPNDNPYVGVDEVYTEIWANGLRNPHRLTWDVDPDNPENNRLIVNDIGLHTWEEVNFITKGANYGYSEREGNERLFGNNSTGPLPAVDEIPVQLDGSQTDGTIAPTYPVLQYGHDNDLELFGDAISSGFVYRGSQIPVLHGKYIFGDISTGQLFWADYEEMQAADDGDPETMAEVHVIDLMWDNPNDEPDDGERFYMSIDPSDPGRNVLGPAFQIVVEAYHDRGGQDPNLPGSAEATGSNGRADLRLAIDADGELYLLSKSDGFIRAFTSAVIDADFDNNQQVDGDDFLIWQRQFGTVGKRLLGDADRDDDVDGADLGHWQDQFGQQNTVAAVPEPATWLLSAIVLIAAAWLRKER